MGGGGRGEWGERGMGGGENGGWGEWGEGGRARGIKKGGDSVI
jgi:hypothetical protein